MYTSYPSFMLPEEGLILFLADVTVLFSKKKQSVYLNLKEFSSHAQGGF
jgi:hypothetical protein